MVSACIAFPLLVIRFLNKSYTHELIESEEFDEKFGALTLDLKKKEKSALLFNVIFMGRRLGYALILIALCQHTRIQPWVIISLNLVVMMFDGIVRPFDLLFDNKFELMNESFMMVSTYFMLGFSTFIPDPDARYTIGWLNIGFLAFMLNLNIGIILYRHLSKLHRYLKLKYTKRAYQKCQALYLERVRDRKEVLEKELAEEIEAELREEEKISSQMEQIPE